MIFKDVLRHLESKNWGEAIKCLKQINFKAIPAEQIVRALPEMENATQTCKNHDFWDVWALVLLKFDQRYKVRLSGQVKVISVEQLKGSQRMPCDISVKTLGATKMGELYKALQIEVAVELQKRRFGDCDAPKILNIVGHAGPNGFTGDNLSASNLATMIAMQFPNVEIVNLYGCNIAANNHRHSLDDGELPYCHDVAVRLYNLGRRFVQINGSTQMEFTGEDGCSMGTDELPLELSMSLSQQEQLAAMVLKDEMLNWWKIQDPQQLLQKFDTWCSEQDLDINPIINHLNFDQPSTMELRDILLTMRTIRHEQSLMESMPDKIERMALVLVNWLQSYISSPSSKKLTLSALLEAFPEDFLAVDLKLDHTNLIRIIRDWWKTQLLLMQNKLENYQIKISYYEPACNASVYADEVFEYLYKLGAENAKGRCQSIIQSSDYKQWAGLYEEADIYTLTPLLRLRPYKLMRVGDREHEVLMKQKCLPDWL